MERLVKYGFVVLISLCLNFSSFAQWNEIYTYHYTGKHGGTAITQFKFLTPDTGYFELDSIVYGTSFSYWDSKFFRTIDGGNSFSQLNFPITNWHINYMEDIKFLNKDTIIVLNDNIDETQTIYFSYNAGLTWNSRVIKRNYFFYYSSKFAAINSKKLYFAEQDFDDSIGISKIVNDTIQSIYKFYFREVEIRDFVFLNDSIVYLELLGDDHVSSLLRINLHSRKYSICRNDSNVNFCSNNFKNDSTIYRKVQFEYVKDTCEYYVTTDHGYNWSKIFFPYKCVNKGNFGNMIYFINNDTGFIVDSYIYKTTNGGNTWKRSKPAIDVWYMQFLNDTLGFIFGNVLMEDTSISWVLMKTENCGTMGVKEISNSEPPYQVFPNPFSDYINIQKKSGINYYAAKLYDNSGKLLKVYDGIQSEIFTMPARQFDSGIYILKLEGKNTSIYYKLIKL